MGLNQLPCLHSTFTCLGGVVVKALAWTFLTMDVVDKMTDICAFLMIAEGFLDVQLLYIDFSVLVHESIGSDDDWKNSDFIKLVHILHLPFQIIILHQFFCVRSKIHATLFEIKYRRQTLVFMNKNDRS
ncbi:hypothetical protein M8J77_026136 [Diaphorina citri]|nr:hypothetical protein M8J77_026136 [Diaphorina citri]